MEIDFKSISRNIWNDIRKETDFQQPQKDTGDYTADFYGTVADDDITFKSLSQLLSGLGHDNTLIFDWKKFAEKPNKVLIQVKTGDGMQDRLETIHNNVPFIYKNMANEVVTTKFTAKLNRRIDYLENFPTYFTDINYNANKISITLKVLYENTRQFLVDAADTPYLKDFRVDDKYVAIMIRSENLVDFSFFIKNVFGNADFEFAKELISRKYGEVIKNCKSNSGLDFLYSNAPDFVLDNLRKYLDYDTIFAHLIQLTKVDSDNLFSDTSGSVIACMKAIGNGKLLYEKFSQDPKLVKTIFYNLDGNSRFNEELLPNKLLFGSILNTLAFFYAEDKKIKGSYKMGGVYMIDTNTISENATEKNNNTIFLQQRLDISLTSLTLEALNEVKGNDGTYYEPFDFVELIQIGDDAKEIPSRVTAIYVKTLAHLDEVKNIQLGIRIGFDALAIILGVVSLGTATPLAIALLEMGIGASDIVVAVNEDELMKTTKGRAFLEAWNGVMLVGAAITLPQALETLFEAGVKVFAMAKAAGNVRVMNLVKTSFLKLLLEIEIANFTKGSIRFLEGNTEIIRETAGVLNEYRLDQLFERGVFTVIGRVSTRSGKITDEVALIYKGEVIVKASKNGFAEASKDLLKSVISEKKFSDNVEAILNRRRNISLADAALLGMTPVSGSKMFLTLIDELNNKIGTLVRYPNGKELYYKMILNSKEIDIFCRIDLFEDNMILRGIPIMKGEHLLFADFNIPIDVNKKFSGLGQIIYEDGLNYFLRNKKYGKVNGQYCVWEKSSMYTDYGGQSINLEQFWLARDAGFSTDEAAFRTFTGKLVKKNGFKNTRFKDEQITKDKVEIIFLK